MHVVSDHPLVRHRVTRLRDRATGSREFRLLACEVATFLAYEALRDLRLEKMSVTTPLAKTVGERVSERVVVVPILRAGLGMLDAVLDAVPSASVGFLGIEHAEDDHVAATQRTKPPPCRGDALALVLGPTVATGGSACRAVAQLKRLGYRRIRLLCLVAAVQGLSRLEAEHPDVMVYAGALDESLDERFRIVPGLGDAGDRVSGTAVDVALSDRMKTLEKRILADGRVDLVESGELLRSVRTHAALDDDMAAFKAELEGMRADGVVDPVESYRIANMLAALADKADGRFAATCADCGRPISGRTFVNGEADCPWCGSRARRST